MMEQDHISFADDAKCQAQAFLDSLPLSVTSLFESQGVDFGTFRENVTLATASDLRVIQAKHIRSGNYKGSKKDRVDIEQDLNDSGPQNFDKTSRSKQRNNSSLAWQSQIYGVGPDSSAPAHFTEGPRLRLIPLVHARGTAAIRLVSFSRRMIPSERPMLLPPEHPVCRLEVPYLQIRYIWWIRKSPVGSHRPVPSPPSRRIR